MKRTLQITSIMLAVMLATLPLMVTVNSSAEDVDDLYTPSPDEVQSVAEIMKAIEDANPQLYWTNDDSGFISIMPMIFPILAAIVVGIVVGAVIAYAANKYSPSGVDNYPTASEANVNAALRELRSDLIVSNWHNIIGMYSKLVTNDGNLIPFTEAYFALQAETAASDLWSETATFVPDRILTRSSYMANYTTYKYNVLSAINEFALAMSDQRTILGDPSLASTYGNMRVGWSWDEYEWVDTAGSAWSAITDYVIPTAENNRVYIDVIDYTERLDNTNYMYVFGGSGKITNAVSGVQHNLPAGATDLLSLGVQPGWYDLTPGVTYAGNLMPSASLNGLDPSAAMILASSGEYALVTPSTDGYNIQKGTTLYQTDEINVHVSYLNESGSAVKVNEDISSSLHAYSIVSKAINEASRATVLAGQSAWLIYDNLGTSSSLIKPSSILAGMQTNTTMTAEQMAAIYAVALKQLAIYGDTVTPEDIKVSRESLDLVVHGDIYYRGTMVAQNAVFTPFTFLEDSTIAVGNHDWNAPGLAMVWATGVTSLADWNGMMVQYEIVQLGEGYQMRVHDIVHSGVQTNILTLTVDSMEMLGLVGYDIPDTLPAFTWEVIETYQWALLALIITWMGLLCYAGVKVNGQAGKAIIVATLVLGSILCLIVTGIMQRWLDGLADTLFGWWPF